MPCQWRAGGMRYDGPVHRAEVGVVLAGGASRRMGRDKALLTLGGLTLLDRQAAKLAALAHKVVVSGDPSRYGSYGRPVVVDPPGAAGPLAGIVAALAGGDALVLAVDLPFVPAPLLSHLMEVAGPDGALVADRETFQPTAAYYRGKALPVARDLLALATDLSLRGFVNRLAVRRLTVSEAAMFGEPSRMFWNVNDEESYARAKDWGESDLASPPEA